MNVVKKIDWIEKMDLNHLDSVWYGGRVVAIETEKYDFCIDAVGDIRFEINGEYFVDKNNSGEARRFLEGHNIHSDEELRKADICWHNNNWFELLIYDKVNKKWIEPYDDAVVEDLNPYDNFEWLSATISDLEGN